MMRCQFWHTSSISHEGKNKEAAFLSRKHGCCRPQWQPLPAELIKTREVRTTVRLGRVLLTFSSFSAMNTSTWWMNKAQCLLRLAHNGNKCMNKRMHKNVFFLIQHFNRAEDYPSTDILRMYNNQTIGRVPWGLDGGFSTMDSALH